MQERNYLADQHCATALSVRRANTEVGDTATARPHCLPASQFHWLLSGQPDDAGYGVVHFHDDDHDTGPGNAVRERGFEAVGGRVSEDRDRQGRKT